MCGLTLNNVDSYTEKKIIHVWTNIKLTITM